MVISNSDGTGKIQNIKISDVFKRIVLKSLPNIVDIKFLDCIYKKFIKNISPYDFSLCEEGIIIEVGVSITIDPQYQPAKTSSQCSSEIVNLFKFAHPDMSDYVKLIITEIKYKEKEVEPLLVKRMKEFLSVFGTSPS